MTITFTVPGKPRGKMRARATVQNGKMRHYTPQLQCSYEMAIKANFWAEVGYKFEPMTCPLRMDVIAMFASPNKTGYADCRPDGDNILKNCAEL